MSMYGMMCTVLWSEVSAALRADGVAAPARSGPAMTKVVHDTVQAVLGPNPPQQVVYTYEQQPDNVEAWRLGRAARASQPGGDPIDHGLSLLKFLQDEGYGVIKLQVSK